MLDARRAILPAACQAGTQAAGRAATAVQDHTAVQITGADCRLMAPSDMRLLCRRAYSGWRLPHRQSMPTQIKIGSSSSAQPRRDTLCSSCPFFLRSCSGLCFAAVTRGQETEQARLLPALAASRGCSSLQQSFKNLTKAAEQATSLCCCLQPQSSHSSTASPSTCGAA